MARRAAIGIGPGGTLSGNNSADNFVAISTANAPRPVPKPPNLRFTALSNDRLDPLFLGVVQAVNEAVLNAMLDAETIIGAPRPPGRGDRRRNPGADRAGWAISLVPSTWLVCCRLALMSAAIQVPLGHWAMR